MQIDVAWRLRPNIAHDLHACYWHDLCLNLTSACLPCQAPSIAAKAEPSPSLQQQRAVQEGEGTPVQVGAAEYARLPLRLARQVSLEQLNDALGFMRAAILPRLAGSAPAEQCGAALCHMLPSHMCACDWHAPRCFVRAAFRRGNQVSHCALH